MHRHHYNLGLLFDEVLSAHARRPALRYSTHEYPYQVVSKWIDQLAGLLLANGRTRGEVIAIAHTKRPLSYAMMLAALRLGVVYVNIDVTSPIARTIRILQTSGTSLLFFDDMAYQEPMTELARVNNCSLLYLDEEQLSDISPKDREKQLRMSRMVDGASIAYIMFTSGSTGIPKGVAVTHQNVLHFIAWGQERFDVTNQDNFANLSPMYFDNSVFDFYVGLFSGASLTPIPRDLLTKPYELVAHIGKMSCTIWFSVPSLLIYLMTMKALTTEGLSSLRVIVFGGEGYPKVELKKLYDLYSRQAQLVNVYGPTECTCICSAYTLDDEDFSDLQGFPTLGILNPNFDYQILDENDQDSDSGELCLIGPNVASGYFNDPERTAASFFNLIEPRRYMKRMYRTGDLVREERSRLYFIGRKDNQIKHMGYRIELEEIEHALAQLPPVIQAAVIYKRINAAYGKLFAFVSCEEDIEEERLLVDLGFLLPEYMLPAKITVLTTLPKNPNGKIDRHQLRELVN